MVGAKPPFGILVSTATAREHGVSGGAQLNYLCYLVYQFNVVAYNSNERLGITIHTSEGSLVVCYVGIHYHSTSRHSRRLRLGKEELSNAYEGNRRYGK